MQGKDIYNRPQMHVGSKDLSSQLEEMNMGQAGGKSAFHQSYLGQHQQFGGISDKVDPNHLAGIEKFAKPMQDYFQFADDLSKVFAVNMAIKFKMFDAMHELGESFSAGELLDKLGFKSNLRHLIDLLDQLYVFGLVEREGLLDKATYRMTDYSRNFLIKSSPNNFSNIFLNLDKYIKKYQNLESSFPYGKTKFFSDEIYSNEEELKCYMDYYYKANEFNFDCLLNSITFVQYKRIVDIHGLTGNLAMMIKNKFPTCEVVSFENSYLKDKAQTRLKGHDMIDIIKLEFGDLRKSPLTEADCFLAPHILMQFGLENKKKLLQHIFSKLNNNGDLIIMENLVDNERSKDSCGLKTAFMFAMMGYEGYTFSFNEYKSLLCEVGFKDVQLLSKQHGLSDIIIAKKLNNIQGQ